MSTDLDGAVSSWVGDCNGGGVHTVWNPVWFVSGNGIGICTGECSRDEAVGL